MLIYSFIDYLFNNSCRYIQIFLEEYGQYTDNTFSIYTILIRSLDNGLSIQEIQHFYNDLKEQKINNFQYKSFLLSENCLISYSEELFYIEPINDIIGYGTSFSFDFVFSMDFPMNFHEFLITRYRKITNFEFMILSTFRDLNEYNLNFLYKPSIDYKLCIIDMLHEFIKENQELSQVIFDNYSLNPENLRQTMLNIMYNNA